MQRYYCVHRRAPLAARDRQISPEASYPALHAGNADSQLWSSIALGGRKTEAVVSNLKAQARLMYPNHYGCQGCLGMAVDICEGLLNDPEHGPLDRRRSGVHPIVNLAGKRKVRAPGEAFNEVLYR